MNHRDKAQLAVFIAMVALGAVFAVRGETTRTKVNDAQAEINAEALKSTEANRELIDQNARVVCALGHLALDLDPAAFTSPTKRDMARVVALLHTIDCRAAFQSAVAEGGDASLPGNQGNQLPGAVARHLRAPPLRQLHRVLLSP